MRKFFAKPALVLGFVLAMNANGFAAGITTVATLPWTNTNALVLNKNLTADIAKEIVRQVIISSSFRNDLDMDVSQPDIWDYGFYDVNGDGSLRLLAILDYSGRGISSYLAVISHDALGFHVSILDTTAAKRGGGQLSKLKNMLTNIKGDGHLELIVSRAITHRKNRTQPFPYFDDIYSFEHGQFVLANKSFLSYYRNVDIPALNSKIEKQRAEIAKQQAMKVPLIDQERSRQQLQTLETSLVAVQTYLASGVEP